MAPIKKSGQHYEIDEHSITLFGLGGTRMGKGKDWALGIDREGVEKPSYISIQVPPDPALEDVVNVIEQEKAHNFGNLGVLARIIMSNRIAVRLFLEGVLNPSDFHQNEEAEMDIHNIARKGIAAPVINLQSVQFGAYKFPVSILSERDIGSHNLAILDIDHTVGRRWNMLCPRGHGPKPGKFCDQCGNQLVAPSQEHYDRPLVVHSKEACPLCGYELKHNHQMFCPGCGRQFIWGCLCTNPESRAAHHH
jgi:hypothetical protein